MFRQEKKASAHRGITSKYSENSETDGNIKAEAAA